MDYKVFPTAHIVGRIANIPQMRQSYRGTTYLKLFIYVFHKKSARLLPLIAFNKRAKQIARLTQQGDLLNITVRIDGIRNRGYINPTLIVSDFVFLEPLKMRQMYHGDTGRQLKLLFPVIPSNYGSYKARKHMKKHEELSASNSKTSGHVVSASIESNDSAESESKASNAFTKSNVDSADVDDDWMSRVNKLSSFKFPGED